MRIRKIPGTIEQLLELSPPLVKEPHHLKGNWQGYFDNNNPIHVELGIGRGRFITTLATNNPLLNYIGIEIIEEVLLRGVTKAWEE